MKKTVIFILSLILPLLTLTGCFDATSIEAFEYCIAIGIDKASSPDKISFSMQMIKPSSSSSDSNSGGSGSSSNSNSKIITVECSSVNNGISIINNYSNKKINLSHCTAVVFSEEIANQGIENYIVALSNTPEIRPTCLLIISSTSSIDFLETSSKSTEQFSSAQYEYIALSSKTTGYTLNSTMYEYITDTQESTPDSIIPYVNVHNDTVQPYGICIMKDHMLKGKLSPIETICHLIITNKLEQCILEIPSPLTGEKNVNIKLRLKSTDKPKININNSAPFIEITSSLEGEILNDSSFYDASSNESLQAITSTLNSYLEKNILNYLYKTSQEFSADIADFARYLKGNYLTTDEWEHVNWNDIYQNSFFDVSLNFNIQSGYLFLKD